MADSKNPAQLSERLQALVRRHGPDVLRPPYKSLSDPVWLESFGKPGARGLYNLTPEESAEIKALNARFTPEEIAELARAL